MKKEFTKQESYEKLKKLSRVITKIISVLQVIMIVGASICLIASILGFLGFGLGWAEAIYEKYPKMAKWEVDYNADFFDISFTSEKISLETLYNEGLLNKMLLGVAINTTIGILQCALIFVALTLFKPLFKTINNSESPFTYEILNKLKFAFIIVTIIALYNSVFVGIIVALFLACIYFMYMYGVKMQEDEDQTL